jgi:hypothetical protein
LPATFQIYDDSRKAKFQDFSGGHYEIDDEGIAAQRVNVVVTETEGMVMSRAPTKQFANSTGTDVAVAAKRPGRPRLPLHRIYRERVSGNP